MWKRGTGPGKRESCRSKAGCEERVPTEGPGVRLGSEFLPVQTIHWSAQAGRDFSEKSRMKSGNGVGNCCWRAEASPAEKEIGSQKACCMVQRVAPESSACW